jgi:hypothetical protein
MSGAVRFVSPAFSWQRRQRREIMRCTTAARTAKPCGPGRRRYGQALAETAFASTGAVSANFAKARETKGIRLPGEHGISRQTTAQGRPCVGLHLYAAVQFFLRYMRAADRGCQPAPGLPCTLLVQEGKEMEQSSGEMSRENAKLRLFEVRRNLITVILRCSPLRRASKDERPGCISAAHPSRLLMGRVAPHASRLRMTELIVSSLRGQRSNPEIRPWKGSGLLRCARNDEIGDSST